MNYFLKLILTNEFRIDKNQILSTNRYLQEIFELNDESFSIETLNSYFIFLYDTLFTYFYCI